MENKNMRKLRSRVSTFAFSLLSAAFILYSFFCSPAAEAKIYIDITSPAIKKLPIAIYDLPGPAGREISEIIRDDLSFTGLFVPIDKNSYLESITQPFNPLNWTPLGIEAVVKGEVVGDGKLTATVALYDTFEGKEVFRKEYRAGKELIRLLAHSIANDIYTAFTGQPGIFKTKIAFVGEEKDGKSIYVMDWDGNRLQRLGLKGDLVLTPHWSADGSKMVYSSERGRQWNIYLLDFLKMTERRAFSSKGVNMAGGFFPSGDSFVLSSSRAGNPDLYIFDTRDKNIRRITTSYGIEVSPAVSPDGKHIAYVSDRGGSPQIYVMRSDGSDIRRVTFEGSYNTSPDWSPLGDRIVFSGREGGKNQVFTIKPDGSDLMRLTESGNNEDPSFSPDGRYVAFSSDRSGTKGIYIMRANGEFQRRITPKDLKAFGPGWSPKLN
jgi:TolB protein